MKNNVIKISMVALLIGASCALQIRSDWRDTAREKAKQLKQALTSDSAKKHYKKLGSAAISGAVNAGFEGGDYADHMQSEVGQQARKEFVDVAGEQHELAGTAASLALVGADAYSASQKAKQAEQERERIVQEKKDAAFANKAMATYANKTESSGQQDPEQIKKDALAAQAQTENTKMAEKANALSEQAYQAKINNEAMMRLEAKDKYDAAKDKYDAATKANQQMADKANAESAVAYDAKQAHQEMVEKANAPKQ